MKKFLKLLVVFFISIALVLPISNTTMAATSSEVAAYGFDVPASGYNYTTWFNNARTIYVHHNGLLIGRTVTVAARARTTTTDSSGYYYDTFLIRTQMEPRVVYSGGEYYRGLNYLSQARTTLGGDRYYVNFAPKATMPESSSTWNVSFSGNAGSDKKFGFTLGTGYSSTIKDHCYDVRTICSTGSKSYDISYNYKPSANIISTAARRARNLWCTNTHQAFYAFTYRTKNTNSTNITVQYNVSFRMARNGSSSWNGSTYNMIVSPHQFQGAISVTYNGSN